MVKFTSKQKPKGRNKMIAKSEKIEKICSFYVSDFHLEMILVPFINNKIDNNEDITIITQKNLRDTLEVLISKMNIKEETKEKILKLNWNKTEELKLKNNSNIIIIGTEEYIEDTNNKIKAFNVNDIRVVDCYNFDEIKDKIEGLINEYDVSLNTLGNNNF